MDILVQNDSNERNILPLVKLSGFAVVLQLLCIIVGMIVTAGLGSIPNTASGYFEMMARSRVMGLLADDFFSVTLVVLYLLTFTGLFFLVARNNFSLALLAILFTFSAVLLVISSHSGFSLLYLSEKYLTTADETVKLQLIAAGEAVISRNIWNSTAGFFSGIFLQGGGVLLSIAMLCSKYFGKITIFSGMLANGLDLIQHLIHYFNPALAAIILYIAGPFYIVWFIVLARDLFKYVKIVNTINGNIAAKTP